MRSVFLVAGLLIGLLWAASIPAASAGDDEPAPAESEPQPFVEEIKALRHEIGELNGRLEELDRLLRTSKTITVTVDTAPHATTRGQKSVPRRYWDGLSENNAQEIVAAEKAATTPFRNWSLSDQWTVDAVTVSNDNRTVLAGGALGEWRLCDIETGNLLFALEHPEIQQVLSVGFSPDGTLLAQGSGKGLHLFSHRNPTEERFVPFSHSVRTLDFSSDGELIAVGGSSPTVHVVRIKDLSVAYKLETGAHFVTSVRFSHDGLRLAMSGGQYANRKPAEAAATGPTPSGLWDLATQVQLFKVPPDERGATIYVDEVVPGKSLLVAKSSGVSIWNLSDASLSRTLAERSRNNVDLDRDGRRLLLGLDDQRVAVFDVDSGRMKHSLQIPSHWRFTACLSPDGHYLVAGGYDGGIRVWEVE